ncbi:MAG: hypothetical protein QNJ34_07855 [Xenococcaceae cyanobacterium MO_188.B29]|nr:hypothetical protein [Xenococcaceae cyanobacterium MO_188.B29]
MLSQLRRLLIQFFRKTRIIGNEPLNKASLIVIIAIDIFILINVFTGLDDISRWYISPYQAYPCHSEWKNYRSQTQPDKDYRIIASFLNNNLRSTNQTSFHQQYQKPATEHLGTVSQICLNYADYKDKVRNPENIQIQQNIDSQQKQISQLEKLNRDIRTQYDSTLLEKIAGQPRDRSINLVEAAKAKQELDQNNTNISQLKEQISNLKKQLITQEESVNFIALLNNQGQFNTIDRQYKKASFWYPSIQLGFQALFLLPLIAIGLAIHNFAQQKGYGLIALISWHLLVIFFVPLIIKIFEFLQIGIIFKFISDVITTLLGQLLFLVSYVYILVIPLVGFGIIKLFQKIIFNTKLQAANRIQQSRCLKCAKKIRTSDSYCPHCGYYQYVECQNCHQFTHKHLSYCSHCGHEQNEV